MDDGLAYRELCINQKTIFGSGDLFALDTGGLIGVRCFLIIMTVF